ncbi:hypothetical protein L873DRAFT_587634 [Choiromyces venosus 120613-1]|uniref:Uncharacterized protein n=1 Tax=Choiromyces venosus 120613-1 TaxID=1336337 RepID=A0A3N4J7J7_9PEZI|nr:hypothetical protein L873DRAFT_587634 [Choiromyces venosus 120613-1]
MSNTTIRSLSLSRTALYSMFDTKNTSSRPPKITPRRYLPNKARHPGPSFLLRKQVWASVIMSLSLFTRKLPYQEYEYGRTPARGMSRRSRTEGREAIWDWFVCGVMVDYQSIMIHHRSRRTKLCLSEAKIIPAT